MINCLNRVIASYSARRLIIREGVDDCVGVCVC